LKKTRLCRRVKYRDVVSSFQGAVRRTTVIGLVVLSACQEQILHDLSETEANRVVSRFSGSSIVPTKVSQSDGRWAIAVSAGDAVSALAFLDSHRVLPARSAHASKGSKGGLVPSREEQWFSYQRAVAHSIEDTLNTLAGVLEAHVHVNLPEHDPLLGRRRDVSGTGSVLLVIDDRFVTKDEEVSSLVAGAAGIPAAQVTVLKSLAAAEAVSVQAPVESSIAAPAAYAQSPKIFTELPQVMNLVSPEIACVAAASFVCGVAGLVALRRRARRRTRFTLPQGGGDEP